MKQEGSLKSRLLWAVSSLAFLGISYGICRVLLPVVNRFFVPSGANMLAAASLFPLSLAISLNSRRLTIATHIGYLGGFLLALIFNTDGVDPGGGSTNNFYIIWIVCFLLSVLAGIFEESFHRAKR